MDINRASGPTRLLLPGAPLVEVWRTCGGMAGMMQVAAAAGEAAGGEAGREAGPGGGVALTVPSLQHRPPLPPSWPPWRPSKEDWIPHTGPRVAVAVAALPMAPPASGATGKGRAVVAPEPVGPGRRAIGMSRVTITTPRVGGVLAEAVGPSLPPGRDLRGMQNMTTPAGVPRRPTGGHPPPPLPPRGQEALHLGPRVLPLLLVASRPGPAML